MSSKPDFMHRIILMIDPLDVKAAGIKVYKIVQKPRCFVFTFPKVSNGNIEGLSCWLLDWLQHGRGCKLCVP